MISLSSVQNDNEKQSGGLIKVLPADLANEVIAPAKARYNFEHVGGVRGTSLSCSCGECLLLASAPKDSPTPIAAKNYGFRQRHTLTPRTSRPRGKAKAAAVVGRKSFSAEQLAWLNLIRDHIATAISIEPDDLELSPFNQRGGLGKAHQLFGEQLPKLLDELNAVLAA